MLMVHLAPGTDSHQQVRKYHQVVELFRMDTVFDIGHLVKV